MVSIYVIDEIQQDDMVYERLEHSVDAENIRRCLAYLTKLYQDVLVQFYMHGESVSRYPSHLIFLQGYTDFIIYTEKDRTANLELERELADKLYKSIWTVLEHGLNELREQDFYKEQGVTKQIKLESFLP